MIVTVKDLIKYLKNLPLCAEISIVNKEDRPFEIVDISFDTVDTVYIDIK